MRERRNAQQESSTLPNAPLVGLVKRWPEFAIAILLSISVLLPFFNVSRASDVGDESAGGRLRDIVKSSSFRPSPDYSKFSHSNPAEHAALTGRQNCGSCHRRRDSSVEPAFPLHKDCTGCHIVQFTASSGLSSVNPICTICHNAEGLNSPAAPLKAYPRLASFTAEFDHAQHLQGIGEARPGRGCAACHVPANRGVAESIPARLNAHRLCYECHSPGRQARATSSCGSCHKFGPYSPTSTTSRSYRLGFSHADHGSRARLNCDRCHDVRPRGFPQRRQVTSIAPVQHLLSFRACISCHNGQRAFGEHGQGNFENCRRCHEGGKFGSLRRKS